MPTTPDLTYAFGLKPEAAARHFQSLGWKLTWDWRQTADAMRAQAFAVSNATRMDILRDIHDGMQRAIDQGLTEKQFIDQMTSTLKRKGWWDTRIDVDTHGRAVKIRLGSPARLKTIYRTNMQNALMTARWRDFMANVDDRPYFEYVAVMDARTRPGHAAMDGRVYRYDDPIWKTHWPPWAYNCRCRVRALSERALKRRGKQVESSTGKLHTVSQPWGFDKRTGEVIDRPGTVLRVIGPNGKMMDIGPSPGFGHNPGMGGGWDPIGDMPDVPPGSSAPPGVGAIARMLEGQKTWKDYGLLDLRRIDAASRLTIPAILPAQSTEDAALDVVAQALGVSPQSPIRMVESPIETVPIDYRWLRHTVEKRDNARERYANFVLPTIQHPREVYLTQYDDGTWRRRYIGLFRSDRQILVIVRVNSDGRLFWNFMQADNRRLNKQRVGELAWRQQ